MKRPAILFTVLFIFCPTVTLSASERVYQKISRMRGSCLKLQSIPISNASSRSLAPIGMIPLLPTPTCDFKVLNRLSNFVHIFFLTGIWSKRDCASCSFTGCTSFSLKFVLRRRTCNRRANQKLYHLPSISSSQPELIWELLPDYNLYLIVKDFFFTPQLMSNPTPPGLTTALGSSMSNAAIFPVK